MQWYILFIVNFGLALLNGWLAVRGEEVVYLNGAVCLFSVAACVMCYTRIKEARRSLKR